MDTIPTAHTTRDAYLPLLNGAVSRRSALRGLGGAGLATAAALAIPQGTVARQGSAELATEPDTGTWKTWVLTSGDQLRPAAPPDAATRDELAEVIAELANQDAVARDRISYWDAGSPGYRWNEIATQQTLRVAMGPDSYRAMALLNAAIYDATIAAWDAKYTYGRLRPAVTDPALSTIIPTPTSPSYPDEHAVTAGAAATVLGYLFPDEAERFATLALEAADSRVMAGVAFPSDTAAGLELGNAVGELVVAHGQADGSDAGFDVAAIPTAPGLWSGDPATLIIPALGTWETWVLASPDQFRPAPPPAADSAERAAEIAEVKGYQRDVAPFTELWFWPQDPAGAGLSTDLQQPGRLLLRPAPPLPLGAGAGAEAVRVPVGHQPAAGGAGPTPWSASRAMTAPWPAGRPRCSIGRRGRTCSMLRSRPCCRPIRYPTTRPAIARGLRLRPKC